MFFKNTYNVKTHVGKKVFKKYTIPAPCLLSSKVDTYKTNNGDKNSKTSLLDLMHLKIELKGVPFFLWSSKLCHAGCTHTHTHI